MPRTSPVPGASVPGLEMSWGPAWMRWPVGPLGRVLTVRCDLSRQSAGQNQPRPQGLPVRRPETGAGAWPERNPETGAGVWPERNPGTEETSG